MNKYNINQSLISSKPTPPWLEVRYFKQKIKFFLTHKVDTEDRYYQQKFKWLEIPQNQASTIYPIR